MEHLLNFPQCFQIYDISKVSKALLWSKGLIVSNFIDSLLVNKGLKLVMAKVMHLSIIICTCIEQYNFSKDA